MEFSEQQTSQTETTEQKTKFFAPLFRVTPLSKYFALALFIALPFVGGVVGYWYGFVDAANTSTLFVHQLSDMSPDTKQTKLLSVNPNEQRYIVSEEMRLGIKPFADRRLQFEVTSYRSKEAPFFTDHVLFKPETGEVVLQNYNYDGDESRLLQLYPYDGKTDIERYIEDKILEEAARQSNTSFETVLAAYDTDIKALVQKVEPQRDLSTVDFRNFCVLKEFNVNGVKVYGLEYHDLYHTPENWPGFICGYGAYMFFENFVVANFAQSVDASEPKVLRHREIQLVE
jgi:hypothetical protein